LFFHENQQFFEIFKNPEVFASENIRERELLSYLVGHRLRCNWAYYL
jgi:hypothetical protein